MPQILYAFIAGYATCLQGEVGHVHLGRTYWHECCIVLVNQPGRPTVGIRHGISHVKDLPSWPKVTLSSSDSLTVCLYCITDVSSKLVDGLHRKPVSHGFVTSPTCDWESFIYAALIS